jgi:hypothetical protein
MRFSSWITKTPDTSSDYAILIASPRQQRLRERASVLRYTCTSSLLVCTQHCLGVPLNGPHFSKFILWKQVNMITFFPIYIWMGLPYFRIFTVTNSVNMHVPTANKHLHFPGISTLPPLHVCICIVICYNVVFFLRHTTLSSHSQTPFICKPWRFRHSTSLR